MVTHLNTYHDIHLLQEYLDPIVGGQMVSMEQLKALSFVTRQILNIHMEFHSALKKRFSVW